MGEGVQIHDFVGFEFAHWVSKKTELFSIIFTFPRQGFNWTLSSSPSISLIPQNWCHLVLFPMLTFESPPWQNQRNGTCAQRRLRSAWVSAQSHQSLRCALTGSIRTQAFFMRTAETLMRLRGGPGWLESWLDAHAILLWGSSFMFTTKTIPLNCIKFYGFYGTINFLSQGAYQVYEYITKLCDFTQFWH